MTMSFPLRRLNIGFFVAPFPVGQAHRLPTDPEKASDALALQRMAPGWSARSAMK